MMQYKMVLELFQKLHPLTYANQFVHDIINYPTFIYPIESGKSGKKEKKLQQFEYVKKKALDLKGKKVQGVFGKTRFLALFSSAVFLLQNYVSDFS